MGRMWLSLALLAPLGAQAAPHTVTGCVAISPADGGGNLYPEGARIEALIFDASGVSVTDSLLVATPQATLGTRGCFSLEFANLLIPRTATIQLRVVLESDDVTVTGPAGLQPVAFSAGTFLSTGTVNAGVLILEETGGSQGPLTGVNSRAVAGIRVLNAFTDFFAELRLLADPDWDPRGRLPVSVPSFIPVEPQFTDGVIFLDHPAIETPFTMARLFAEAVFAVDGARGLEFDEDAPQPPIYEFVYPFTEPPYRWVDDSGVVTHNGWEQASSALVDGYAHFVAGQLTGTDVCPSTPTLNFDGPHRPSNVTDFLCALVSGEVRTHGALNIVGGPGRLISTSRGEFSNVVSAAGAHGQLFVSQWPLGLGSGELLEIMPDGSQQPSSLLPAGAYMDLAGFSHADLGGTTPGLCAISADGLEADAVVCSHRAPIPMPPGTLSGRRYDIAVGGRRIWVTLGGYLYSRPLVEFGGGGAWTIEVAQSDVLRGVAYSGGALYVAKDHTVYQCSGTGECADMFSNGAIAGQSAATGYWRGPVGAFSNIHALRPHSQGVAILDDFGVAVWSRADDTVSSVVGTGLDLILPNELHERALGLATPNANEFARSTAAWSGAHFVFDTGLEGTAISTESERFSGTQFAPRRYVGDASVGAAEEHYCGRDEVGGASELAWALHAGNTFRPGQDSGTVFDVIAEWTSEFNIDPAPVNRVSSIAGVEPLPFDQSGLPQDRCSPFANDLVEYFGPVIQRSRTGRSLRSPHLSLPADLTPVTYSDATEPPLGLVGWAFPDDEDRDGIGDAEDLCPAEPTFQLDVNGDGCIDDRPVLAEATRDLIGKVADQALLRTLTESPRSLDKLIESGDDHLAAVKFATAYRQAGDHRRPDLVAILRGVAATSAQERPHVAPMRPQQGQKLQSRIDQYYEGVEAFSLGDEDAAVSAWTQMLRKPDHR